jgi:hypothetical protein
VRSVERLPHVCMVKAPAAPDFRLERVALDCMRQGAQIAELLHITRTGYRAQVLSSSANATQI